MRKERKHYTAEEKVGILRRHLLDKVPVSDLCEELGLQPTVFYRWQNKFYDWRGRYGRVNEHNGWIPRDFWLQPWEKQAIIGFHLEHPLEGYRRLTFMMLDADVVAVSPASVWRVLQQAGLLWRWKGKPSGKRTGFEQPPQPHQHWHIDVSYINVSGTFYYLCSILDGYRVCVKTRFDTSSILRLEEARCRNFWTKTVCFFLHRAVEALELSAFDQGYAD